MDAIGSPIVIVDKDTRARWDDLDLKGKQGGWGRAVIGSETRCSGNGLGAGGRGHVRLDHEHLAISGRDVERQRWAEQREAGVSKYGGGDGQRIASTQIFDGEAGSSNVSAEHLQDVRAGAQLIDRW